MSEPTRRDVLADLIFASLSACYTFDGERGIAETAYQGVIKEIRHNLDRAAPLVPRWVPVGERVPEKEGWYPVIWKGGRAILEYRIGRWWWSWCGDPDGVDAEDEVDPDMPPTHWLDGVPEVPEC